MAFSINLPDHWTVLDLNPATRDRWLEAFLASRLPRRSQERRDPRLREAMLDAIEQLHQQKTFMAALLVADAGGETISANATLAWRRMDTHGEGIPVAGLEAVYARAPASTGEDLSARRVKVVGLPIGGGVKVASRQAMQLPGMDRPRVVSLTQYFVPLRDTDWLGVITAGTATLPIAAGVEDVADTMAASLSAKPGTR